MNDTMQWLAVGVILIVVAVSIIKRISSAKRHVSCDGCKHSHDCLKNKQDESDSCKPSSED